MTTKTVAALAASAALIASLAACGSSNTIQPAKSAQPAAATQAPAQAPSTQAPAPQGVAKFGESVKFPNGVSVTSTATVKKAGEDPNNAIDGQIVIVTTSVTNGSPAAFNAFMTSYPEVTYGAKGLKASSAWDATTDVGSPIGNLLPGETQTVVNGFGVPAADLGDVRVEYSGPTYKDQPAVFRGAVK